MHPFHAHEAYHVGFMGKSIVDFHSKLSRELHAWKVDPATGQIMA